jgi:hypothetical protein
VVVSVGTLSIFEDLPAETGKSGLSGKQFLIKCLSFHLSYELVIMRANLSFLGLRN